MRAVLAVSALLALLSVAFAVNIKPQSDAVNQFRHFQNQFNKVYTNDEFAQRFAIFKDNLETINQLNAKSTSATFGITQFADLTKEEFTSTYMSKTPAVRDPSWPVAADLPLGAVPATFDWRTQGAVTPVKNQGQCGSCWSFSTTGNVEGQWFLAGNTLTSLSEQNLVDCDHECMEYQNQSSCDAGCNGGLQPNAYNYIIKNGGIDTEASYPYTAANGKCNFNKANVGATVNNFTMISTDEAQMAAYLAANGPLAIAADATEWQFYFGGIFDIPCGSSLDHGILIVGYGNGTTTLGHHLDYWIVKNSWGATWGEKGYLRIERGVGKCGLNTFASSSVINKKN